MKPGEWKPSGRPAPLTLVSLPSLWIRLIRQILQPNVLTFADFLPRGIDPSEEILVVPKPIVEPVIFVSKADYNGRRFAVPGNKHSVLFGFPDDIS